MLPESTICLLRRLQIRISTFWGPLLDTKSAVIMLKNTYYFVVLYLIAILFVIIVSSRGPQKVEILIFRRLSKQMVDSSSI